MSEEQPGLIDEPVSEIESDVPLGKSSVPRSRGPIGEQASEVHQMSFSDEVTFEQLTVSKYRSVRAVFREYLTNAIGTCLKARDYLDGSYSPTIHVAHYPHKNLVVIEDNGMGVSREKLDEMLNPGQSENRYRPDRPGKFGIGRLSGAVATGADGGYVMDTTSRLTGETITGIWSGLDFAEYDDMESSFGEDQYGTRFKIPFKEDVDVQEHLSKLASYSRIPVLYTEHNSDGTESYSDEYGGTRYTMDANPKKSAVFENDYLRAVVGESGSCGANDLSEKVVVLDTPIKSESSVKIHFPFDYWGLLLKEENARIVSGPNKGLIRISNAEYDSMDAEHREEYIPERDCSDDDIHLPTPVGDRDRLHENSEFFEWLTARLVEATVRKIREGVEHFLSTTDTTAKMLDYDAFIYLGNHVSKTFANRHRGYRRHRTNYARNRKSGVLNALITYFGGQYPDSRFEDLKILLYRTIEYCPPNAGNPAVARSREKSGLWRAFHERGPDGDVFMAVSPNRRKSRVLWEDSRKHALIRISEAKKYEKYEQYGFRKLKTITEDLSEFDCSQEAKDAFKKPDSTDIYENPNAGKQAEERQLSVHWHTRESSNPRVTSDWEHHTESVMVSDLYDAFENGYSSLSSVDDDNTVALETPNEIVLFPPSTDYNLSDYRKSVGVHGTWVANCAKMTADYLSALPQVRIIDDVLTEAASYPITTPEGVFTLPEIQEHEPYEVYLFHILDERVIDSFRATSLSLIDSAKEAVRKNGPNPREDIRDFYGDGPDHPEVAYIPVLPEEIRILHTLFPTFDTERIGVIGDGSQITLPDVLCRSTSQAKKVYASYRLEEWEGSSVYTKMTGSNCPSLSRGGIEIIEMLASYADEGYPPDLDELPFAPFDPESVGEFRGQQ